MKMNMQKKFLLGEFFFGPGGLGYGSSLAKITNKKNIEYSIDHAWASDYDIVIPNLNRMRR